MPLDRTSIKQQLHQQGTHLATARAAGGRMDAVSLHLALGRLHPTSLAILAWAWWGCAPEALMSLDLLELEADLKPARRGALARAARRLGVTWQSAEEQLRRAQVELAGLLAALAASEAGLDFNSGKP